MRCGAVAAMWCLFCVQPVCSRQRALIEAAKQEHKQLSKLFTVAFTVNLVLFLLALYALKSLSDAFAEMEGVTVYDPFVVRGLGGCGIVGDDAD